MGHQVEDNANPKAKPFLPRGMVAKIEKALMERYEKFLEYGERFRVSGSVDNEAWLLCVTFENQDRSLHLPVETAVVEAQNPGCTQDDARAILIDFADYFFDRYFKDARYATLPIDWADFPFGDHTVRARGWERNLKLEEAADRLLDGEAPDDIA